MPTKLRNIPHGNGHFFPAQGDELFFGTRRERPVERVALPLRLLPPQHGVD